MSKNTIAGHGQNSHEVPTVTGLVVEMGDGNHAGTSVWKRMKRAGVRDFCFVIHDRKKVKYAPRCILVAGQDVEEIRHETFGCDLDSPRGMFLIGVDLDDDLTWLTAGSEVLWDSAA